MITFFSDDVLNLSWSAELTDKDDVFLNDVWYNGDQLLLELSRTVPMFYNKTSWSDLDLDHFQVLILKCFDHLQEDQNMDQLTLSYKEPFTSFRFLAGAFIKCARIADVRGFEMVSFKRTRNGRLHVELTKTFSFAFEEVSRPKPKPSFTVVVDNTK